MPCFIHKKEAEGEASLQPDWAYAHGRPSQQARIKQEFADFQVDEELGFAPSGGGEHLFVKVRKTDITTVDTARRFSEVTGVRMKDIGYAGMKDRRAECSQWFSLKLPDGGEGRVQGVEDDKLRILNLERNQRKLRIGSHRGNHFRLHLRQPSGEREAWTQRLMTIRDDGVPNYFGPQRFGRSFENIKEVERLLQDESRLKRGMLYSAARAYLFNEVLSHRIKQGNWNRYLGGDVLELNGGGGRFTLTPQQVWDDELQQRLDGFDIHPTGPLAGIIKNADRYTPTAETADMEKTVLARFPKLVTGLQRNGLYADRRALRTAVTELDWNWQDDGDLSISFFLPRGAYATSVIREICLTSPNLTGIDMAPPNLT